MSIQSTLPASALPVILLPALHRAAAASVSPEAAVQILRFVGVEAAQGIFEAFTRWCAAARMDSAPVATLAEGEFWSLLSEFFATQGLGSLEHQHLHPGVIAVSSSDWSEAGQGASGAGCHVATGLLAELLRIVADREVAVLEVECRSTGSDSCRFVIGSPAALETLHAQLAAGSELPRAVEALA